jgi:hypothetical protein
MKYFLTTIAPQHLGVIGSLGLYVGVYEITPLCCGGRRRTDFLHTNYNMGIELYADMSTDRKMGVFQPEIRSGGQFSF